MHPSALASPDPLEKDTDNRRSNQGRQETGPNADLIDQHAIAVPVKCEALATLNQCRQPYATPPSVAK